jgi:TBP-interacting protein
MVIIMSEIIVGNPKTPKWSSIHSHISGLGLDENGKAKPIADGLVGQVQAREACGLIVDLIREGKLGGKGILFAGPSGTGKTALAVAITKELGEDTPFVSINASEILSANNKTEFMTQAFRRAIGIRMREVRKIISGVVTDIKYLKKSSPFYPTPILGGAKIKLETKDDSKDVSVGPEIATQFQSLGIRKGDVIMIDEETGEVRRLGRVKEKSTIGFDIDTEKQMDMPTGKIQSTREVVRTFTLHDVDVSIAAQRVAFSIFGFLSEERGIDDQVRKQSDEMVRKITSENKAQLIPGVLFIDDAHMLDIEAYSFLTKAMESEYAPIIILATNRGITTIRGTDEKAPHGMPRDLLDRLLIILTKPYNEDEITSIVKIRADELDIPLTEEAIKFLTKIGTERSLRYALQLLDPAKVISTKRNSIKVDVQDIEMTSKLFSDIKESTEFLEKYKDLMIK